MGHPTADVVICGAGIAGVATAYHLAVKQGVREVVLVDKRAPLTLTSDKSTEAYRNWWPGPDDTMVRFMNRSIDLLEGLADESGNSFLLNRRGYLYATGDGTQVEAMRSLCEVAERQGAGPVRYHTGAAGDPDYLPSSPEAYRDQPAGADLIVDRALIRRWFPYLSERIVAVLHARRCGWFSGQQLGMYLLEQAQAHGVRFMSGRVTGVETHGGAVGHVCVAGEGDTQRLATRAFVNAAGPMVRQVGRMVGVELPVFSERHLKVSFKDELDAIPREAPTLIWHDPQAVDWAEEEREALAGSPETRRLLGTLPAGVHARPEGGLNSPNVLLLWPYDAEPVAEQFPIPVDPLLPEVALRGMATMVPALAAYQERLPRPYIDGGYYTKTEENRPLIGPLPVDGAYVIGALSGYGLMAACAAGELLAAQITGGSLPDYAPAFRLARYEDPAYRQMMEQWDTDMQL